MLSRKKQKNTFIVGQLMNSVDTMSATADTLRVKVFKTDIFSSGCENVPQHAG